MINETALTNLVEVYNSDKKNKRKIYFTVVQKERYIEINFGSHKEQVFIFKKYIKPKDDPTFEREKLFYEAIQAIFSRMWLLIKNNKF